GWATREQLRCTVRTAQRARDLADRFGVRVETDSVGAAAECEVLLIAVKPQNMHALLDEIAPKVRPAQTVISVAAGVPTGFIEQRLAEGVPVVRVMSNVPVQVDEAMSAIAPGRHAGPDHLAAAEAILGHVGRVVHLGEEHLDAVTALSGSGPAYFFLLAEAMIDAGILLGLSRDVSTELVIQTMVGSAKMLRDTGRHPVELREAVTSPGGTTISAIRVLEQERVRAAFLNAIEAAKRRSEELAGG
ncbi:MAG: pyrroline-5-carboxylate reductase, partial [Actinomycetota bacterium]|nr:pyrroline-5-carboxylate reductase [Actinomycetota bacterium]